MPVRLCLFCPTPLDPKTRLEHPVLNRIGGRLRSRELICDSCNHGLGAAIDSPLADQFKTLCHALWVRSGTGDEPPTLRGVQSELGLLDIGPAGAHKSEIKWPQPEPAPDGKGYTLKLDARNTDHMVEQLVHSARRIGITTFEQFKARWRPPEQMYADKTPIPPLNLPLGVGDPEHLRSIAKSAIEILAVHDADAARSAELDAVRRFITRGEGDRVAWLFTDGPALPFSDEELGAFPHVVSVWAETGSPMFARVTLFGYFHFLVVLADSWSGGPLAISHAVDPLAERQHGIRPFTVKPSTPALADVPTERPDPRVFDERCYHPFVLKAQPIGRKRNIDWLVRQRIEQVTSSWPEGTVIGDAEIEQLTNAAMEVYRSANKIPQRVPIDADDLLRRVSEAFDQLNAGGSK